MRAYERKMSLEDYYFFYLHGRQWRTYRDHLNQVLAMHGFLKLHNHSKESILRCVESIELMPPARSTLPHIGVSSGGLLTADVIADDLEALGWKECPNCSQAEAVANQEENPATDVAPGVSARTSIRTRHRGIRRSVPRAPPADFVIVGKRPRSKLKRVSLSSLNAILSSRAAALCELPASSPPRPPLPPYPRSPTPPPPEFLDTEDSSPPSAPSSPSWEPSPTHWSRIWKSPLPSSPAWP